MEFTQTILGSHFDRNYKFTHLSTDRRTSLWGLYDLRSLNRRTVDGQHEPENYSLRGHLLTEGQNDHNEPGLVGVNESITEQRQLAMGQTLINVTDWVLMEAMRRETGDPSLDVKTVTCFPQIVQEPFVGNSRFGCARSTGLKARLIGSGNVVIPKGGVRFSVGPKA